MGLKNVRHEGTEKVVSLKSESCLQNRNFQTQLELSFYGRLFDHNVTHYTERVLKKPNLAGIRPAGTQQVRVNIFAIPRWNHARMVNRNVQSDLGNGIFTNYEEPLPGQVCGYALSKMKTVCGTSYLIRS